MTDSQRLLAEYVESGSEQAFRELVARYLGLVYSAAVRLLDGDTHLAEDVSQTVFADLAGMARSLSGRVMLGGWLHRHTCFVAAKTRRAERRRQFREREAVAMNALQNTSDTHLAQIAPMLDDAINRLGARDRTAILFRYFEQRDFRAIGEVLGSSEDAAQKRVTRALEKLRVLLARRGVALSGGALATALGSEAVTAAPAGLAASVAASALKSAAVAGGLGLGLGKVLVSLKFKVAAGVVVVALVGAILVLERQRQKPLTAVGTAPQRPPGIAVASKPPGDQLNTPIPRREIPVRVITNTPAATFQWGAVESSDYRRYIANLRATECPERVIRDIIIAEVCKLYNAKLAAMPGAYHPRSYWKRNPKAHDEWFWKQRYAFQQEKVALLKELLGEDLDLSRELDQLYTKPNPDAYLCFLSPDKQTQVRQIEGRFGKLIAEVGDKAIAEEISSETEDATMSALRKEQAAELAQVLTPQELEEYKLRTSQTATDLRYFLEDFTPTPEEFRAIFKILQERVEGGGTIPERNEAIKARLGEKRFAEYERSTDGTYLSAKNIAARDRLPKDSAIKVFEVKKAVEQEAQHIRADESLSGEERRRRLAAVKIETEAALVAALGRKGFRTLREEGGRYWLNNLPLE